MKTVASPAGFEPATSSLEGLGKTADHNGRSHTFPVCAPTEIIQEKQPVRTPLQPDKAPFSDGSGEAVELFVHSGKCCLCQIGISTGASDFKGREIHTGDIVSLYRAEPGEDGAIELFTPLTVVIADQFQSFSDGSVKLVERPMQFFSMGIKNVGISSPEWPVAIVKKYHDVIEGEHWTEWGFSYHQNEAAAALSPRSARHG